ncbi:MAG: zinc ribbon domain-containing protein [Anaerosomatales bacterium]|nr:zinc ribbon domain-containing protein [Anaerosomatales bacterium]
MEVAMPKYDYKCETCGTVFEVARSIGDASPERCPECGGGSKRVFSPVGIVFKGSGFHNTDYKPRPKEEGSSKASSEPSTSGACPAASSGCGSCPAVGS